MHTNYLQMPPDGSGKKVITNKTYILTVSGLGTVQDNNVVKIDDTVQNLSGSVKLYVKQINTFSKILYCMYTSSLNEGAQLSLGDSIYVSTNLVTPIGSLTAAPYFMYFNMGTNVSFDNPYHGQLVDERGQAYIRFAEGAQQIDPTGKTRTSQAVNIGYYDFVHGVSDDIMGSLTTGSASSYALPAEQAAVLETTNASGDRIVFQTHKYHSNMKNIGLNISMAVGNGDSGKTNSVRRWGYYDDEDGFFFELDGTSLYAVKRHHSVDSRVAQTSFNTDTINGGGISKFNLTIAATNRFFIDIHNSVRTRMGVYDDKGTRITCHLFTEANSIDGLENTNLPVRFENINTSGTAGNSQLKVYYAAVSTESREHQYVTEFFEHTSPRTTITSSEFTPIMSIRPKSGTGNHCVAVLKGICIDCTKVTDNDSDARAEVKIVREATLSGDTWAVTGNGDWDFEVDTAATSCYLGTQSDAMFKTFVKGTFQCTIMEKFFTYLLNPLCLHADGTQPVYTIIARSISPSASVVIGMGWDEYEA